MFYIVTETKYYKSIMNEFIHITKILKFGKYYHYVFENKTKYSINISIMLNYHNNLDSKFSLV